MRRSWRLGTVPAGFGILLAAGAMAQPPGQGIRPVRIGLTGGEVDACLSLAEVRGLDRNGDNFLSVRARPSRVAPALDRLGTGRQVWICDSDAVPGWAGIVYPAEPGENCRVGSPVATPRTYGGPCRQGWVAARYLAVIAG